MAKKKVLVRPPQARTGRFRPSWLWLSLGIVLVAYAWPLASGNSSIQWDAVDVHYSAQKYFAERLMHGELPFWTPYIFAGFPFLADPQTGAWYPGNWPFFLTGAGPKALEAELAFHALLAAAGVFLLLRRWLKGSGPPAGALCYALGGFFAGHSSHIGMFQSAALFPWLLLALFMAVEGAFYRGAFVGTLAGGALVLAGHFQTALYAFSALGVSVVGIVVIRRGTSVRKAAGFFVIVVAGSALLSAIQTLPGLELTTQSVRASVSYSAATDGALKLEALGTLALPDYLGATTGNYSGPGDVTQYYFYSGFLLLPLAMLGLQNVAIRPYALWLGVPALFYTAGPALGVFRLISWLPGFRSVRAPVHAWFIIAMALGMLAGAGAGWLQSRWSWTGPVVVTILAFDLCTNNVWNNPLAYAHQSFQSLYGKGLDLARQQVVPVIPPLTRFEAPDQLTALGPMNHPLDLRLETTYGYNPLALSHYAEFREAVNRNPKLRDSLSVSRVLDPAHGSIRDNPSWLPRAYFPKELLTVSNDAEDRRALDSLDPPRQAVLIGSLPPVLQDTEASVTLQAIGEQAYRIAYKTATPSVLRVGVPYYPGWEATVDGARCTLLRADHAMTAIVVPAGDKQLELRFHSTYFRTGAALSSLGILILSGLGILGRKKNGQTTKP